MEYIVNGLLILLLGTLYFFRDPVSFPERYLRRLQQLQIP